MGQSWLSIGLGLQGGSGSGGTPVPPVSGLSIGMNLHDFQSFSGARPYTNLAQSNYWRASQAPGNTPLMPANVDNLGDLILVPTGQTVTRSFHTPDASGATVCVVWWEGSPTGPTLAGTFSGMTGISTKAGGYYREFTHTGTDYFTSSAWISVAQAALTGDGTVRSLKVVEKTIFDAHADPRDIPIWYSQFVTDLTTHGWSPLRFMDLMETNDSGLSVMTWANRARVNNSATLARRNAFRHWSPGGVDAQALTLAAKEFYVDAESYFGARTNAPLSPFGANGNMIALVFNAPSGAGSVSVDDTVPGEITITVTETAATPGAANIISLLTASAAASRWIDTSPGSQLDLSGWGNNAGTTAIGPLAKTFLQYGMDSLAQDGCPIEWMIDLTNQVGSDPWFPMPFQADETYVRTFWAYVEANLAAPRTPRGELANEIWHSGFMVYGECTALAERAGQTFQEYRATRHQQIMSWIVDECPRALRVLGVQNANLSDYTSLLAVSGTAAATDIASPAPYIASGNDMEDTPSLTTDVDVIFDRIEADHIETWIDMCVAIKDVADAQSPPHVVELYEWQQHMLLFANATTYGNVQASPRMQRAIGIGFDRLRRRVNPRRITFFGDYYRIDNTTGSWGAKTSILALDADSPKLLAALKAQDGLFPAYFELGEKPSLTGPFNVGQTVTIDLPTSYNVTAQEVRLYAGATLLGTDITEYLLTSAEIGDTLTVEVDLTGTDGETFTYVSDAFGPVEALEKIDVWTLTRIAANGWQITVPADWNPADNEVCGFGNGGNGFVASAGGNYRSGGGGRCYGEKANHGAWSATQNIPVATIGGAGSAQDLNVNSGEFILDAAGNGTNVATTGGGLGGQAANCVGFDFAYDGGDGGGVAGTFQGAAGGGGDAGPLGAGKDGASVPSGSSGVGGGGSNGGSSSAGQISGGSRGGDGGDGSAGTGNGVGGDATTDATDGVDGGGGGGGWNANGHYHGGDGGREVLFIDTADPSRVEGPMGGGGGAASDAAAIGGDGGGGAGSRAAGGLGEPAAFILRYRP